MRNNFTWQMDLFLRRLLKITTNASNHRTVFYFEKVWKKDMKFCKHHPHPKKLLLTLSIRLTAKKLLQTLSIRLTALGRQQQQQHHLIIVKKDFYSDLKKSLLHVRSMSTYYAYLNAYCRFYCIQSTNILLKVGCRYLKTWCDDWMTIIHN